jgi:hypothetical protein
MAAAYAYRGDADRAMKWLEQAYREKDTELCFIRFEPIFRKLSSDPRYQNFLHKMNLPI